MEIKSDEQDIKELINETKALFLDEEMNEERLKTLRKVFLLYNKIKVDKLIYLLKLKSKTARLSWLKNQKLDFDFIIKDDEIVFEKKILTEQQDEVSQAIDSLLKQFDEWSKTDIGKKK